MFLLPLPLLFAGLGAIGRGNAAEMLGELGGFAGLMLSAWLLNEGLRAEEAYDARAVARPPAIPRKLFAAVLTGASVASPGVLEPRPGPLRGALAFGVVAGGGAPPRLRARPDAKKGLEGVDEFATERVARAIDQAEELVRQTVDAAKRDRRPAARGPRRAALRPGARGLPRRSSATRATSAGRAPSSASICSACATRRSKFADVWSRSRDAEARRRLRGAARRPRDRASPRSAPHLLEDDRSDLDIEIEVLRERLQQDGLVAR